MNRLLVTGATGFIGRRCLRSIDRRIFEIFAVSRSSAADEESPGIHWIAVDLFDQHSTDAMLARVGASHLLHLAWIATPGAYWESPLNADWVQASLHLTRRFAAHGGRRVVAAGSCVEYDWTRGPCVEDETPLAPRGFYGLCKQAYREILFALASKLGITAAWGRVFFAYGLGEPPEKLVTSCATSLLAGRSFRCTNPAQANDFIYVDDVASMFARLLLSDSEGAFNLGSGSATTVEQVVRTVAGTLGREDLVQIASSTDAVRQPVVADMTRTISATAYAPVYDIEAGVRAILETLGAAPR